MKTAVKSLAACSTIALLVGITASCSSGTSSEQAKTSTTLTVAVPSNISNFDPATNQLIEYIYTIRNTVFSTLVKYDDKLDVVPDLATPKVSSDAKKYTFALRENAKFQDGTPVDAAAVITSLKRVAGGKSIYSSYLGDVASYSSPDDHTVVVTLKKSNAAFLDGLVNIAVVAPKKMGQVGSHPVGSGPYEFVSAKANRQITLKRFDGYYGKKPVMKEIDFKIATDPQVAVNNLYSGAVDAVSEASVSAVKQVNTGKATVVRPASSNSMLLFEFNSSGKLADPRVKQALAYALDRKTVRSVGYNDGGEITSSAVPSGSYEVTLPGYPYDLAKAKALLAEAGKSDLSVNLVVLAGYPEATKAAQVWQRSLAKIGVKLNIETQATSVYLEHYVKHDYDVIWGFFNESGDPNSFFNTIILPHLQDDYENPKMRAQIAAALAITDRTRRAAAYESLAKDVNEELPVMIVQTRPLAALSGKSVKGLRVNPLGWLLVDGVTSA